MAHNADPIHILLVEDSASDAELTMDALGASRVPHEVHRVCDGIEALDFLYRRGPYRGAPRPQLILLDLNMPRMNGYELLAELKLVDEFALIPVVVLTTSSSEQDIIRSYQLRANCYVSKPVALDEFLAAVQDTGNFWLERAQRPSI